MTSEVFWGIPNTCLAAILQTLTTMKLMLTSAVMTGLRKGWRTEFLMVSSLLLSCICNGQGQPQFKLLHSFGGPGDGDAPSSGVVFDSMGNLYGTTSVGGAYGYGAVYELSPQKDGMWAETILHSFPDPQSTEDGSKPSGGVTIDPQDNLYGTTTLGGANSRGTIFQLTPSADGWQETILYNFCSLPGCKDGGTPVSAPVLDPFGNLYGDATETLYELTPGAAGWTESVLYTFCAQPQCPDGQFPGPIIRDRFGNLYGPTQEGGTGQCGVVFILMPPAAGHQEWVEHALHDFYRDGCAPTGLTLHDEALYGTADVGGQGNECDGGGCGTVFELTSNGKRVRPHETILHSFSDFADGQYPEGAPVFDRAGNTYGVASFGGAPCGCGLVFKLQATGNAWQFEILHEFTGPDGDQPLAGLTIDKAGNLYGTTNGGSTGGVVFEIIMPQAVPAVGSRLRHNLDRSEQ
jgi:uncharacterized repeat protein (TIGR03803 family)